jgi:multiple sugar transport system substrate-binding protein
MVRDNRLMGYRLSRRRLLHLSGIAAAAAGTGILAACGGGSAATNTPAVANAATAPVTAAPAASTPAAGTSAGSPTGAASSSAQAGTTSAAAPSIPVNTKASGTVKFWHVWGGDRQPLIEKVITDFQTVYPSIKVEHTVLSQQGLQEKYLTAIAGGQPPDVLMLNTKDLPNFASRNALRGVDDLIQRDGLDVKGLYYACDLTSSTYDSKLFGLPLTPGGGNRLVFWNKAIFKEVGLDPEHGPTNWTEFSDYAKKLTKGSGGNFERIGSLFYVSDNNNFIDWSTCNAGQLYSPDGKTVQFDAKENVEALQYMVDNLNNLYGGYDKIRGFATEPGPGGGEGNQSFFQGKEAMHFSGVFHFLQLSKEAPNLDYGVTIFPYNDKNPAAKSLQASLGLWNYMLPKGSKNTDAGWELIKYFCAGKGEYNFFQVQGRPSSVRQYNTDPAYSQGNPHWPIVAQALELTQPVPITPVFSEDQTILQQYTEESLLNKRSPADALKTARVDAQKVHDEKLKG